MSEDANKPDDAGPPSSDKPTMRELLIKAGFKVIDEPPGTGFIIPICGPIQTPKPPK